MVNKKVVAVIAAQALLAFAVLLAPVKAQDVPEIPAEPHIVDVEGDGNGLNDQGLNPAVCNGSTCVGPGDQGDNSGGASIGAGDILEVWFTEDADTISVNLHTTFPPPHSRFAIMYRIQMNPGEGIDSVGCTWVEGYIPGGSWAGELSVRVRELCLEPAIDEETPGGVVVHALDDETGITTITFPKSVHPGFADGQTLVAPRASSRGVIGSGTDPRRTAPQFDNTEAGTDYVVGSGSGGGGGPKPQPTATGTGAPAPTASPGTTPSPKPTSPPDKDKKKKCPNKKKGSNSKKCKKKKGKGRGPAQPKPSPSPTSTPAPTTRPPTPSPSPTG